MSVATANTEDAATIKAKDGARLLGMSEGKFYEALNRGEIAGAFKIGERWIIGRARFLRMLEGE